METPWGCAQTIAEFLNEKFLAYDEKESATGILYRAYAGMLPIFAKAAEMKKNCPSIAVCPSLIEDAEKETIATMTIYAVTYDDDQKCGVAMLYHILEFMRFHLLVNNPIANRYQIKLKDSETMETSLPDEQPYPFWIGRIDFAVYLEQPSNDKRREKYGKNGKRKK